MAFSKKDSLDSRINEYRDTSGISTRRLDVGLWYLRHRKKFIVIFIAVLALTAASTIGYSLYKFSDYVFFGRFEDQKIYLELTSGSSFVTSKTNAGNNLSYSEVRILPSSANRHDVVAAVTNTNDRSVVNISYYFDINGEKIGAAQDFIFPGDTKYLMALGQSITAVNPRANLVIEDVSFGRIDRHAISDWAKYRADRLDFLIKDAVFKAGVESGLSEKVSLGELNFDITNQSAYGYKTVKLAILLKSRGEVAAATYYWLDNFRSGENRQIRLTWPGHLPVIDQVDIVPDINILDDNVYLRYSSL